MQLLVSTFLFPGEICLDIVDHRKIDSFDALPNF